MLDYYHYTKDPSYNDVVIQALLAPTNIGPDHDYMPPEHAFEEGNDDLAFWGTAVISAAERNFPQPNATLPSWLQLGANVFNSLHSRWNSTNCKGGLLWQIYPSNPNGMNYKNSVSNGGFFQIAARMARATGNSTYLDWAEKIWDWSWDVGFIDHDSYHVYDGAESNTQCAPVNKIAFTYTSGLYLYGASVMANHTGKAEWAQRASKLLDGALWFFSPFENATDVMYEAGCETVDRCDADMTTFKGYLSRFMYQSALLQPALRPTVDKYLEASAKAAAKSCTGGANGTECGLRWYFGKYDGVPGLGQDMCALETIQGLLAHDAPPPLEGDQIKVVRNTTWPAQGPPPLQAKAAATTTGNPHQSNEAKPTKRSGAVPTAEPNLIWLTMASCAALAAWGLA